MTEIFTARSIDEAKEMAKQFAAGNSLKLVRLSVIEDAKKGFLGIGKTDAKVEASFEKITVPKPETKPEAAAKPAAAESEPEPEAAAKPAAAEPEPEPEAAAKSAAAESEPEPETAATPVAPAPEPEKETIKKSAVTETSENDSDEYSIENFTLIEDDELVHAKVKIARDYITSILRAMEIDVRFKIYQNEKGAVIELESDNNGTIIGKRGETLDSLQYLCSIIANKGDKDYFRITIDCYGYRKKRRETLEQLAAKVAKSVLRTGRSQPLEPMNPYERRVIHSAISKIDGVSSRSVGEEPYRKIIISSINPRRNNSKRRDNGHRNDKRNNHRKNHENFEPKAIDLSTSFEKDYKKPKPEDSIDTGLYGKIEI